MNAIRINALDQTPLEDIVHCMGLAFADYFVPLPSDVGFWRERYKAAGVDYSLSYGAFDGDRLVACVINGIDDRGHGLTAFNTGTGVIPEYRGQGIVDKIYATSLPEFRQRGIQRCQLEVIDQNARAIRVYERIGFRSIRRLKCYKGDIPALDRSVNLRPLSIPSIIKSHQSIGPYSWDHHFAAILAAPANHAAREVHIGSQAIGYFIIKPEDGYVPQLEAYTGDWAAVFAGIRSINEHFRCNNIDAGRNDLIDFLDQNRIENVIDQFEMEYILPPKS